MNSIEVSAFCLYRNEVRWTKTNTTLLETGDNSWCHFRPMEIERKEGEMREGWEGHPAWASRVNKAGVRDSQMGKKKPRVHILL